MVRFTAWYLPNGFSRADEISPRVARTRAAFTDSSSRLPSPRSAAPVSAARAASTARWSRRARTWARRLSWDSRTAWLSTTSTSMADSSVRRYLFTPTMVSRPESICACRRAAASSMRILGMPVSMALAIPPRLSISWMWCQALCRSWCVKLST